MRRIFGFLLWKVTRVRRVNLQPKKSKNLPQTLFQGYLRKVETDFKKRESSTSLWEVSPEVTLSPASKKNYDKTKRQDDALTSSE